MWNFVPANGYSVWAQPTPVTGVQSAQGAHIDVLLPSWYRDGENWTVWWLGNWTGDPRQSSGWWAGQLDQSFPPGTPFTALNAAPADVGGVQPDVYAVRADGQVVTSWSRDEPHNIWNGWSIVGDGVFAPLTPIGGVCAHRYSTDLFAVGTDQRIWTAWLHPDQGWQGWRPVLDEQFEQETPVTAISTRDRWIDLFAVDLNGFVQTAWYHTAGEWEGWQPVLDGRFRPRTPIAAISVADEAIDLFAVGEDGGVKTAWFRAAQGWAPVGHGVFSQLTPITALWKPGYPHLGHPMRDPRLCLFAVGTDGKVWQIVYSVQERQWGEWELINSEQPEVFRQRAPLKGFVLPGDNIFLFGMAEMQAYWMTEAPLEVYPPPAPPQQPQPQPMQPMQRPMPMPNHFDFILGAYLSATDDWMEFITPDPAQMWIAAAPPGTDPAHAMHHPLSLTALGWTAHIDASDHWMGTWNYQCHIGGVDAEGQQAALDSPVYSYDWEVRSPAAYLHCGSGGQGIDFEWSSNVANA